VLKKIYFTDYRFSEDLDFTLLNTEITNEQIFEWFKEGFEYVKEESNISLAIINNKPETCKSFTDFFPVFTGNNRGIACKALG
jgi:predicted nucleotidyltransferase component of viral defense system